MSPKSKTRKPSAREAVALAPEQAASMSTQIADSVRADMQAAETGMFHALRAGVGLLRIRELHIDGSWEERMMNLFPGKTARTLQRYMQIASNFLEAKELEAKDAWNDMASIRTDRLLAAPADAAPGNGAKLDPLERDVGEFVREFGSIRQALKGTPQESDKSGRPLTRGEKIEAAKAVWNRYANLIQEEALNRSSIHLLPDEELDGVASTLRTAYDAMRKELASRGSKA